MFFSVSYDSDDVIARGNFICPHCQKSAVFSQHRVTKKETGFAVFMAFGGVTDVIGEYVHCHGCGRNLDVSVLLEANAEITASAVESSLRNIVTLSDAAVAEIRRRMTEGGFDSGVYVRLVPSREGAECEVKFDYPYADDEEWLGRSQGLPIVIDRDLAELIMGFEVDFDGEQFLAR